MRFKNAAVISIGIIAVLSSMAYLIFTIKEIHACEKKPEMKAPEQVIIYMYDEPDTYSKKETRPLDISHISAGLPEDEPVPTEDQEEKSEQFSEDDEEILLRLAMAEAEGEGAEGKALVMRVVLNRIASEEFPGSIRQVVFEDNQFSSVRKGGRYWNKTPDEECREALQMIKDGWDQSQGALYFESRLNSWQSKNRSLLFKHGGHRFYE